MKVCLMDRGEVTAVTWQEKKTSASVQPSSGVRNVGGFSARQVTLCCQDSQLHALVRPTCALAPKYNAVTKKLFLVQVERVAQVQ